MDTFPVVKRKDKAAPGRDRTEEMSLSISDELQMLELARPGEVVAGGWTP